MKKKFDMSGLLQKYMMYIVLIVLLVIFEVLCKTMTGRDFLSMANIMNILGNYSYQIIVGIGITFIMLGGAMDLSTGYILSSVGIAMSLVDINTGSWILAIGVGIILGVVFSGFNGVMYAWLKVFPFIITLAMQYILNGTTYLLTGGAQKTFRGSELSGVYKVLGGYNIPFIGGSSLKSGVVVMIILVIIGSLILNKTHFGRNVYALGSNPDAVALSGVSVAKMRIAIFALAGLFFALAQIVNIGRMGSASQSMGVGDEFTVMAGAMLGGIKMGGGGGKMNNMVVGVLIISVLNQGFNFLNINTYWQYVALGCVLLFAVALDTLQTRAVINAAKKVSGTAPAASTQA
ncbi:MAG: ABC transporter permease [Clostridiales bacterium]|nr:ABC transporter permease [Clostridiales bacterium]